MIFNNKLKSSLKSCGRLVLSDRIDFLKCERTKRPYTTSACGFNSTPTYHSVHLKSVTFFQRPCKVKPMTNKYID